MNTTTGAHLDAGKTALRQYIRAGGGFVGIHNAFGTEYNWPWYEGLLGNANYYDHGANQAGDVVIVNSDSSTDGLPKRLGFQDEWYNLVPFPTRVKFLANVDENSLATKRTTHPGHGNFHPVSWCQYYDGGRSWVTTLGHDGACVHRRLGLPGPGGFQASHRQRHPVGDGQDPVLPVTIEVFSTKQSIAGPTGPAFYFGRGRSRCARPRRTAMTLNSRTASRLRTHAARLCAGVGGVLGLTLACAVAPPGPDTGDLPAELRERLAFVAPVELTPVGARVFFTAFHAQSGQELWITDGTAEGTRLVRDLQPGSRSGFPANGIAFGDRLVFSATDGQTGVELWRSDGTVEGTTQVLDLQRGPESSTPNAMTPLGDALLFVANDGRSGFQLWALPRGGATPQQLTRGGGALHGAVPRQLTRVGARVFFTATDTRSGHELWVTDGTAAGTRPVKDVRAGPEDGSIANLVALGAVLYFTANDGVHGAELWRSDGTEAGTVLVKDIRAGADGSRPAYLRVLGDRLYLSADDGRNGQELWRSDGTAAGTTLVTDIRAGRDGSHPSHITVLGGHLYFAAMEAQRGVELWRSDGTAAGTALVADINPGAGSGSPARLAAVNEPPVVLGERRCRRRRAVDVRRHGCRHAACRRSRTGRRELVSVVVHGARDARAVRRGRRQRQRAALGAQRQRRGHAHRLAAAVALAALRRKKRRAVRGVRRRTRRFSSRRSCPSAAG